MNFIKRLGNKYIITAALFAVWMFFFDQNDFFTQQERSSELQATRNNIAYIENEVAKMEREYNALISDPHTLERFARERYRMKKDDEDIYVVEQK